MIRRLAAFVSVAAILAQTPRVWATTYALDPAHTTVAFKIRHLFSKVEITLEVEGLATPSS